MSSCCSTHKAKEKAKPKRHRCPVCHKEYGEVALKTVLHHLKTPWDLTEEAMAEEATTEGALKAQAYFFCSEPHCEVVYFGEDDATITQAQLRTTVGIKAQADDEALICYCFDVSRKAARTEEKARAFVVEQTKKARCACTIRNPSGRCCLKDFPKGDDKD